MSFSNFVKGCLISCVLPCALFPYLPDQITSFEGKMSAAIGKPFSIKDLVVNSTDAPLAYPLTKKAVEDRVDLYKKRAEELPFKDGGEGAGYSESGYGGYEGGATPFSASLSEAGISEDELRRLLTVACVYNSLGASAGDVSALSKIDPADTASVINTATQMAVNSFYYDRFGGYQNASVNYENLKSVLAAAGLDGDNVLKSATDAVASGVESAGKVTELAEVLGVSVPTPIRFVDFSLNLDRCLNGAIGLGSNLSSSVPLDDFKVDGFELDLSTAAKSAAALFKSAAGSVPSDLLSNPDKLSEFATKSFRVNEVLESDPSIIERVLEDGVVYDGVYSDRKVYVITPGGASSLGINQDGKSSTQDRLERYASYSDCVYAVSSSFASDISNSEGVLSGGISITDRVVSIPKGVVNASGSPFNGLVGSKEIVHLDAANGTANVVKLSLADGEIVKNGLVTAPCLDYIRIEREDRSTVSKKKVLEEDTEFRYFVTRTSEYGNSVANDKIDALNTIVNDYLPTKGELAARNAYKPELDGKMLELKQAEAAIATEQAKGSAADPSIIDNVRVRIEGLTADIGNIRAQMNKACPEEKVNRIDGIVVLLDAVNVTLPIGDAAIGDAKLFVPDRGELMMVANTGSSNPSDSADAPIALGSGSSSSGASSDGKSYKFMGAKLYQGDNNNTHWVILSKHGESSQEATGSVNSRMDAIEQKQDSIEELRRALEGTAPAPVGGDKGDEDVSF